MDTHVSICSHVTCDFTPTLHFASVCWFVRHIELFLLFVLASLLLPKCSSDLKCGPCPLACDWDSRVSGLSFFAVISGQKRVVEDFGPTPFLLLGLRNIGARISLDSYHTRVEAHLGNIYVQNTAFQDPQDEDDHV